MPTLNYYTAFECTANGRQLTGGSRSNPIAITVTGIVEDFEIALTTGSTWTPWQTATGPDTITNFKFLYVVSDQIVQLELTADVGNAVGTDLFCHKLLANTPYTLACDGAYGNYTANFATGTLEHLDRLRIKNSSGQTANIRMTLVA